MCGQLVKMLINLEPNGIFGSIFFILMYFKIVLSSHWYEKGDKHHRASIGRLSSLVKMLIILEPHSTCVFGSNFVYLCILT